MPSAIRPVSPAVFKSILEQDGFSVESEDTYNWTLFKKNSPKPVITIPQKGDVLSVLVMMGVLSEIKMNNARYFELLKFIKN